MTNGPSPKEQAAFQTWWDSKQVKPVCPACQSGAWALHAGIGIPTLDTHGKLTGVFAAFRVLSCVACGVAQFFPTAKWAGRPVK